MEFKLGSAASLRLQDQELFDLLHRVYVGGGYTDKDRASHLLAPSAVRQRGDLICAREKQSSIIAGMLTVVFAHSPSKILATDKECEIHLLAVLPQFRQQGLGLKLINAALYRAQMAKKTKVLLWTQPSMSAAHKLYRRAGFKRDSSHDFERAGRQFCFFQRPLNIQS